MLRANLAELSRIVLAIKSPVQPLREILFWQRPLISFFLAVGWQLLIVYPQYLPCCIPLLGIVILNVTYRQAAAAPPLLRPLPFWRMCSTVFLPRRMAARRIQPLTADDRQQSTRPERVAPCAPWMVVRAANAFGVCAHVADSVIMRPSANFAEGSKRALQRSGSKIAETLGLGERSEGERAPPHARVEAESNREAAASATARAALTASAVRTTAPMASAAPVLPSLRSQTLGLTKAVAAEELSDDAALETVTLLWRRMKLLCKLIGQAIRSGLRLKPLRSRRRFRGVRSSLDKVKGAVNSIDTNAINPMAWVLGPVQNGVGQILLHARDVQRMITWQDSAATSLIYLALIALSLILALIPWATVIPFMIIWAARLVGAAVLGPHMWWVGQRVVAIDEQAQAKARAEADEKAAADHLKAAQESIRPEKEDWYVFEMPSVRQLPRQPCVPQLRRAYIVTEH